jgi:hypothetical protein
MRPAKIFLFLLLIATGFALIIRYLLLDDILARILNHSGLTRTSIQVCTITPRETKLTRLSASCVLPSGDKYAFRLTDVSLRYDFSSLFTGRTLKEVRIGGMAIRRTAGSRNKTPVQVPERIILLDNELRTLLPRTRLIVEKLQLQGAFPDFLTGTPVRAVLEHAKTTALSGNLALQEPDGASYELHFQSPDSGQAEADLVARKNGKQAGTAHFLMLPHRVEATLHARSELFNNLIRNFSNVPLPDSIIDARFSFPVPLPDNSGIDLQTSLVVEEKTRLSCSATVDPAHSSLRATLTGTSQNRTFFRSTLQAEPGNLDADFTLDAEIFPRVVQPFLQSRTPPLPRLSGTVAGTLRLEHDDSAQQSFSVDAQARELRCIDLAAATTRIHLQGTRKNNNIMFEAGSLLQAENIRFKDTHLDSVRASLAGNIAWKKTNAILTLTDEHLLQFHQLTAGPAHIDTLALQTAEPVTLNVQGNTRNILPTGMMVAPFTLTLGKRRADVGPLEIKLRRLHNRSGRLEISADIAASDVRALQGKEQIAFKDLKGSVSLQDTVVKGDLKFSPAKIPGRVAVRIAHDIPANRGSFQLRTIRRLDLQGPETRLSSLFAPWPWPADLDSGYIALKAEGKWRADRPVALDAFISITQGAGFFQNHLFEGLELRQDLTLVPALQSKSGGSFVIKKLTGAVDTHDIRTNVLFRPSAKGPLPILLIRDFSASLLGGKISVPRFTCDLNQPDTLINAEISTIDLHDLVELINMNSLQVRGSVSGTIPLKIQGRQVTVDHGKLVNDPPGGTIRYTPGSTGQTGLTGYALRAVEDFRYTSLVADAVYTPSGRLDLDIHLQGTSPGLETSRPVHLNIHAEQNLPALLQSLRFSKGLTEKLDKRIQGHYK